MRVMLRSLVFALITVALLSAPGAAQSDILLQLRSGSPAGDRFRVDSAGGVVAMGEIGWGIIPASGAGWRMMWHPQKVAFRAGYVDAGGQWDEGNIGYYSWAGGALTTAAGIYSFAMGNQNTVESGAQAGIALGSSNRITTTGPFGVALGLSNEVLNHSGVAIGNNNHSNGDAAVALGYTTTADADYSMAFGYRASTNGHTGAKVFGDASTTDSIEAVANNEFAVRAAGGYRLRTNATLTTGCNLPAGSGVFSCSSSRLLKDEFTAVDGEDMLHRISLMPIERWQYTTEAGNVWHLGPTAQDFRAAFGLGVDDENIGLLDIAGVSLRGVQALEARTARQDEEIAARDARIAELEAQVAALAAANATLDDRVRRIEQALGGAE